MKILFLTHFYQPEVGAAIKRISGLATKLKDMGHQVDVITGFPNYPTGVKADNYKGKFNMKETIEGLRVFRYYVYSSPKKTGMVRILNYLSLCLSSLFFCFRKEKYDVLIVSSPPIFLGLTGYIISRIKGIKLIFDVRDIWPDIALEMGELKKESIIYRFMDVVANFMYRNADCTTVVSNGKYDKLLQKGLDKDRLKLVSNGFDSEFLQNVLDEAIITKYKLKEKYCFLYTGVVGLAQGIDLIIDTAALLRDYEDICFIIVGDGFEKKSLEKRVFDEGLKNVTFTGVQPNSKVFTFLTFATASIVPLKNENLKDSVPTKMLESLGVGCPVILCARGESEDILEKSKGGLVVSPGDRVGLKNSILKLYKNTDLRNNMATEGRKFVMENFTREKIAKKLEEILLLQILN